MLATRAKVSSVLRARRVEEKPRIRRIGIDGDGKFREGAVRRDVSVVYYRDNSLETAALRLSSLLLFPRLPFSSSAFVGLSGCGSRLHTMTDCTSCRETRSGGGKPSTRGEISLVGADSRERLYAPKCGFG